MQDFKTQRIEKFVTLLNNGYNAWMEAGALVAQEMELDYRFAAKVNAVHPEISVDTVLAFDRIGRKKLHPMLAASNAPGVRRLRKMPYEMQQKFCAEPIKIYVAEGDTEDTAQSVSVFAMGSTHAKQVFSSDRVRNVAEQRDFVKSLNGHLPKVERVEPAPKFSRAPVDRVTNITSPVARAGTTVIARYAVRKAIGSNCGFERTQANPPTKTIIELCGGVAVIEVVERVKKEDL